MLLISLYVVLLRSFVLHLICTQQGLHDLVTEIHNELISEDTMVTIDSFSKFAEPNRVWSFDQNLQELDEMVEDGAVPLVVILMKRLQLLEDLTDSYVGPDLSAEGVDSVSLALP